MARGGARGGGGGGVGVALSCCTSRTVGLLASVCVCMVPAQQFASLHGRPMDFNFPDPPKLINTDESNNTFMSRLDGNCCVSTYASWRLLCHDSSTTLLTDT